MNNNWKYWPQIVAGVVVILLALSIFLSRIAGIGIQLIAAVAGAACVIYLTRTIDAKYNQAFDNMEKSRKLLSKILGDSPAAIVFIKDDKVVWASQAAENILGWPVEKWLKEPSLAFIYPSQEEFTRVNREVIYKDIARRDHLVYEYDYVHKDGHRVPTLVIMRAIDKENLKQGFILSMIDNAERRKAQDLAQKLNEGLEQKVRERTAELEEKLRELERFREATVDRELRMKQLKEEVAQLKEAAKE